MSDAIALNNLGACLFTQHVALADNLVLHALGHSVTTEWIAFRTQGTRGQMRKKCFLCQLGH